MAFYLHAFYELFIFSNIGELYRNQPLTSMSFQKMPTETCRKTIYALSRGTGVISFTSFPNVTPLYVRSQPRYAAKQKQVIERWNLDRNLPRYTRYYQNISNLIETYARG